MGNDIEDLLDQMIELCLFEGSAVNQLYGVSGGGGRLYPLIQIRSLHILHNDASEAQHFSVVINLYDVWMIQLKILIIRSPRKKNYRFHAFNLILEMALTEIRFHKFESDMFIRRKFQNFIDRSKMPRFYKFANLIPFGI